MCPETTITNNILSRPVFHLLILAFLTSLIFFYNLGGWDLWNPDEPRYAQVAREMVESGNWILPRLNNQIYPDKPPVFFWLIAFSYKMVGEINSFAARLPSALTAIAGVLLTYMLGSQLYGPMTGFISALMLSTMAEYFWLGRRANIDMTLNLFILSALFFFYAWYRIKASHPRSLSLYLFYFFMAAATLTKGPVGFLLPLLTVTVYLSCKKDMHSLKRVFKHPGVFLFFAVVLAWVIPACIQGGDEYRNEILFKQTIGRVHNSWSHKEPFYYYVTTLPFLIYPWIFFLPSAFLYLFAGRKRISEDFLFPVIWFITIFVFFTLCSGKRELYLLPLFPAAALMIGFLFNRFFGNDPFFNRRLIAIPLYLLIGCNLAAYLIVPFFVRKFGEQYPQVLNFYLLLIMLGFTCALALYFLTKKRETVTFTLIIIMMTGSFLYAAGVILPSANEFKSAKPLSLRIKDYMEQGDLLVSYRLNSEIPAFNFYTGTGEIKQFETFSELIPYLTQSDRHIFCLMQRKYFSQLAPTIPVSLFEWDAAVIGRHEIVLVANYARKRKEML